MSCQIAWGDKFLSDMWTKNKNMYFRRENWEPVVPMDMKFSGVVVFGQETKVPHEWKFERLRSTWLCSEKYPGHIYQTVKQD